MVTSPMFSSVPMAQVASLGMVYVTLTRIVWTVRTNVFVPGLSGTLYLQRQAVRRRTRRRVPDTLNCSITAAGPYPAEALPSCDHESSKGPKNFNPIELCLTEAFEEFHFLFRNYITNVSEYCKVNCSHVNKFDDGWERFCDHIQPGHVFIYEFLCDPGDFIESYDIGAICDEKIDCTNQADEIGCPERYYCRDNQTVDWVALDKVCDNIKDCANGADECGTCHSGILSSSEFLIQSKVILVVTVVMGIMIITMNMKEGYRCWTMDCSSKAKAIDNIILLQIFFHDTLMGAYLCFLFLAAIVLRFKGDYCILERQWRASSICSILGALFSFSSHGSLLGIASVSIIRFLTCHSLVVDINKRAVVIGSTFIAFLNVFHSVLPLLPVKEIKNTFRTEIFFTNLDQNPFFSSNPLNMSRLDVVYQGMLHRQEDDLYKMISDLKNVTSRSEIFDVTEISYYGNTGLCVHNIFKSQDSYEIYKLIYCSVLLVLLSAVSTAYIKIVLKERRSNRAVNPNEEDPVAAALTLKVALMIGSQLACWIPFILTALYFQYVTKGPASPTVFEVFSLVVIPINSILNPVFYSETYKKVKDAVWGNWRQTVSYLTSLRTAQKLNTIGPSDVIEMTDPACSHADDQGTIPTGEQLDQRKSQSLNHGVNQRFGSDVSAE